MTDDNRKSASENGVRPEGCVVAERFRLQSVLGGGAQGRTYVARDLDTGSDVLVKQFHVEATDNWKAIELFDRSATVLESLEHPAIPGYRDHFEEEADGEVDLFLVRDLIPGESLQDCIDEGRSFDEREVMGMLEQLLDALDYLHGQMPPVIHRDIKPANIIIGPDGTVSLVDFGAVQAELLSETGGSTIVGTAGYVAPEQLMGKASPASDIYSLGVTIVHVMTHTPPAELPSDGFELEFESVLEASGQLTRLLREMTRVDAGERLGTARSVDEALANPHALSPVVEASSETLAAPSGSALELVREGDTLVVQTPSKVLYWDSVARDRWSKTIIYSGCTLFIALPALATVGLALAGIGWTALGMAVPLLAAASFIVFLIKRRRRLAFTFGAEGLHVQLPSFRPRPTEHNRWKTAGHRLRAADLWVDWDDIQGAAVTREKQNGGTADAWKIRIDCSRAQVPHRSGHASRETIRGPVYIEPNFTHGENIWIARLIDDRATKRG